MGDYSGKWHLDLFSTILNRRLSYHLVCGTRRYVRPRKQEVSDGNSSHESSKKNCESGAAIQQGSRGICVCRYPAPTSRDEQPGGILAASRK